MRFATPRRGNPGGAIEETLEQDAAPRAPELDASPGSKAPESTVDAAAAAPPDAFAQTASAGGSPPSPKDETSEIPPSLYSRFEAFEFLGRGGMGAVYKARDLRLGREVAIKLLFGADPELGGSILREARSQARIVHENVCEVYEAGTADHVRFIVMQLIHGEPLDKARSAMTLEEKVRVVRQVASALHEAHRIGLVHRDVKPANIMVERGDDGAWKPYIMDFGLAREMGDTGATMTGALMGTPSFMAPEQAAGKVRSLDRRTDVYCLGATLYDVLAGRPPLVADSLVSLLLSIEHEEPPQVRQFERDVPLDLEVIVMKCLEKQPVARYDSAKALGDDLQRFLDGDPVEARARSLGYVLWKRAKRHKGKVAFASVMLVVAAVFVGAWIRARRISAEQAILSRELGESVKEMEFFLRNAHGMPLHDIDRERNIVRERLKAIESRMSAAGEIGAGPGHYALGRGYLTLQEPEAALAHLKQAEAAGYRSAGLDYAMGMALSEVYKKQLADTKRMEGEQKKQRIAAIEADYKEPALAHLKAALGGAIEAPAYVEGLIAFYEGRHEEALAKAREAFEKAPWLYEAKKLEGDVLFATGSKFGHDAAFDYEKMSKWFGEADTAYRVAVEIGRSDPAVRLSMCELYTQEMCGAYAHESAMRTRFDAAKAACEKGIAAHPAGNAGRVSLAQVHAQYAWRIAASSEPEDNPEETLSTATRHAEEAASRNTEDPMAPYVVGMVWRSQVSYASDRGLAVEPAAGKAIEAYDEALKRDPTFVWALNESCSVYRFRTRHELMHGIDVRRSFEEGLARCKRASELDPSFVYATITAANHWLVLAEQKVAQGHAPSDEAREIGALVERLRQQSPRSPLVLRLQVMPALLEARHLIELGGDPLPLLDRAEARVKEHAQVEPKTTMTQKLRGETAMVRARFLASRGEDPSPWVAEARDAFGTVLKVRPWDLDYRAWSADVEVLALRSSHRQGKATKAQNDGTLASVERLVDVEGEDPRLYWAIGEIRELRAAFSIEHGGDVETEIAEGLAAVDRSLAMHPHMAPALACKGRLFLLRAMSSADRSDARASAKSALGAFTAAFRENPLLERQERQRVESARHLAGDGPSKQE